MDGVYGLVIGGHGVRIRSGVYLYNRKNHPLHPWHTNIFKWQGRSFKNLSQWLGYEKTCHFGLGDAVKRGVLDCTTGWEVERYLRHKLPKDGDWPGFGRRLKRNLPKALRLLAAANPGFVKQLLAIREPVIGFCTRGHLGTGLDLANARPHKLFTPSTWHQSNLLGLELVKLRQRLREEQETCNVETAERFISE